MPGLKPWPAVFPSVGKGSVFSPRVAVPVHRCLFLSSPVGSKNSAGELSWEAGCLFYRNLCCLCLLSVRSHELFPHPGTFSSSAGGVVHVAGGECSLLGDEGWSLESPLADSPGSEFLLLCAGALSGCSLKRMGIIFFLFSKGSWPCFQNR